MRAGPGGHGDRECEAGADSVAGAGGGYSEWITESCMVLISSLELSASCHGAGRPAGRAGSCRRSAGSAKWQAVAAAAAAAVATGNRVF